MYTTNTKNHHGLPVSQQRPLFLLEGIGGVFNYGCEAIVRGTTAILKNKWPDCKVEYVSRRPAEDRKALSGLKLDVVPQYLGPAVPRRIFNGACKALKLSKRLHWGEFEEWAKHSDAVLSIGGDLFTLAPEEKTSTEFYLVNQAKRMFDNNIKLVLWGASVGPFEENPKALSAYREILAQMHLITVRERVTEEYLASLGIVDNVKRVADPAFMMEPVEPKQKYADLIPEGDFVAINLSPLSTHFVRSSATDDLVKSQKQLIESIIERFSMEVILVPHVICSWKPIDDDYAFMQKIRESLPADLQSRVKILPPDIGAQVTKYVVGKSRLLIAARMHCAVAGLSQGVPTILLSYSSKSVGMCEYVYGSQDYVLPLNAPVEEILLRADAMHSNSSQITDVLNARMQTIRQEALKAGEYLQDVLN